MRGVWLGFPFVAIPWRGGGLLFLCHREFQTGMTNPVVLGACVFVILAVIALAADAADKWLKGYRAARHAEIMRERGE